ncbi:uncharacterized protein LACBIDRAFT_301987 [Laccaria bicolor S238N-H82]|uniref:Predicted protein n=1 Tax=Laccaria bicolor (strain S238N-H82 / ATCC MYA-4686) TaxID=486041 RepID=B0CQA6_LACBS|nr:uncharacterized protein LACBIDRAFT_301987 [Laccaria bicolor S238N-H82]EDR16171.1 predicted protein [Laccaria bicolor S238N-H82]|eukprot:XP_001874379.1 predicted protein [Laccaria bicolor S238N-H82]
MPPIPTDFPLDIVAVVRRGNGAAAGAWRGGLTPGGVDLIAMIVSDSGLASTEPQWWNCSTKGCVFIGLQPRGGWQVMQRAVQWGNDPISSMFGVTCSKPSRYAYFSCSIRNRLEKWDSPAWSSPTEAVDNASGWKDVGGSHVRRPTKLIDGSRGGQAFICSLLLPEKETSYTIDVQARMQFRSILLVAAGLMKPNSLVHLDDIMENDFQLSPRLGVIFRRLLIILAIANVIVMGIAIATVYSIFRDNLFGKVIPYVAQAASLLLWAVGAIGLLMLGGNPRVKNIILPDSDLPPYILNRLAELKTKVSKEGLVEIQFGSIHGSHYIPDHGSCSLPFFVVDRMCRWEIGVVRSRNWYFGIGWWSTCLLLSIGLQIMGAQVATVASEIFSIIVLLMTALARGYGVAGPEEWLIPGRKSRRTAGYGASLVGKFEARAGA